MLFNSIEFLFFFPVVTLLYFLSPHKFRWFILLVASCFFYMFFKPEYILILAFTIVIDYYAGILMEDQPNDEKKRKYLVASIIANVGVLAIFKYYNFINNNITGIASLLGMKNHIPALNMLLPVGLSFHTFQAMSYTIEVYRSNQKAERHFGIYSLYVMLYPQLVAGPIERPQNVLHQFYEKHKFNYEDAVIGLNQIAYGLLKKMVVADRLSIYVTSVYNNIEKANSLTTLMACCFFMVQIYCDFSGYSDIALGTARIMGFRLMVNFNRPFKSKNIREFWRRWHISLSTWFNDYLYMPLTYHFMQWEIKGVALAVFITFLVSGLWHGASLQFVIWGGLFGLAIAYEILTAKWRAKVCSYLPKKVADRTGQVLTFAYCAFAGIFFRAETFAKSKAIIKKLFSFEFKTNLTQLAAENGPLNLLLSFVAIGILWLSYRLPEDLKLKHNVPFLVATTFLIIIMGKYAGAEFIYFQF